MISFVSIAKLLKMQISISELFHLLTWKTSKLNIKVLNKEEVPQVCNYCKNK